MKYMPRLLAALILFHVVLCVAHSQEIPWLKSMHEGFAKAHQTGKLVLIEFHNPN